MSKRGKNKQKYRGPQLGTRNSKPETAAAAPALNLDFMNAASVVTGEWDNVQFVLVGCGGIGAYMAQHIGRLMRVIYDNGQGANFTLVDPDIVEEKNLGRQLFCDAEVGQRKAEALARRYGPAWGLNTMVYVDEYSESQVLGNSTDLIVLVGCVDNAKARGVLHQTLAHNPESVFMGPPKVWWLDCGNLKDTGRVMLGTAFQPEQCESAFIEPGKVAVLPSPALQYPSLLIPGKDERSTVDGQRSDLSCADLQAANLQSLNINAAIAVQAADMLTRLLITHDLKRYQCAVNLASGSVKSFYCTPEEIAREIQRPVEFVVRQEREQARSAAA